MQEKSRNIVLRLLKAGFWVYVSDSAITAGIVIVEERSIMEIDILAGSTDCRWGCNPDVPVPEKARDWDRYITKAEKWLKAYPADLHAAGIYRGLRAKWETGTHAAWLLDVGRGKPERGGDSVTKTVLALENLDHRYLAPVTRSEAVRGALDAVGRENPDYLRLLEMHFVRRKSPESVMLELGIGRSTFFSRRKEALLRFASYLGFVPLE